MTTSLLAETPTRSEFREDAIRAYDTLLNSTSTERISVVVNNITTPYDTITLETIDQNGLEVDSGDHTNKYTYGDRGFQQDTYANNTATVNADLVIDVTRLWSSGSSSAVDAFTVPGVLSTDIIKVTFANYPTQNVTFVSAVPTTDTVTVTLTGNNTSNDALIQIQVLRTRANFWSW